MKKFIEALNNGKGFAFLTDWEKYSELTKDQMRDIAKELVYAIENSGLIKSDINDIYETATENLTESYHYETEGGIKEIMKQYDVELAIINQDGIIEMWDADAIQDYITAESAEEALDLAKDYIRNSIINNGNDPDKEIIELRAREIGIDYLPIEGMDGWIYSN